MNPLFIDTKNRPVLAQTFTENATSGLNSIVVRNSPRLDVTNSTFSNYATSVFFDGIFSEPRLQHPEGIAVDRTGHVWCGSENGEILRIAPDGSGIERMATTEGFVLGLAFDATGTLYACDLKHQSVFRYDPGTGALDRFATGMKIPNYPVVDVRRGCLTCRTATISRIPDRASGASIW